MASVVLDRAHFVSHVCEDMGSLVRELARGAGAIMLAEEVLTGPALAELTGALAAQPPRSDVPVLVLARQGADSPAIANAMDEIANYTDIQRPMRVAALVSAVRTALGPKPRIAASSSTTRLPARAARVLANPGAVRSASHPPAASTEPRVNTNAVGAAARAATAESGR